MIFGTVSCVFCRPRRSLQCSCSHMVRYVDVIGSLKRERCSSFAKSIMKFAFGVMVCLTDGGCFNSLVVRDDVIKIDARRYWFSPERISVHNSTKLVVKGIAWNSNEISIVSSARSGYDVVLGSCHLHVNSDGVRVAVSQGGTITYDGLVREIRIIDKFDSLKIIANQYVGSCIRGEIIYEGPCLFPSQKEHVYIIEPNGCEIEIRFPYTFY